MRKAAWVGQTPCPELRFAEESCAWGWQSMWLGGHWPHLGPSQPLITLAAKMRCVLWLDSCGELPGVACRAQCGHRRLNHLLERGEGGAGPGLPYSFWSGTYRIESFKWRTRMTFLNPYHQLFLFLGSPFFSSMTKRHSQVSNKYGPNKNHEPTCPAPIPSWVNKWKTLNPRLGRLLFPTCDA